MRRRILAPGECGKSPSPGKQLGEESLCGAANQLHMWLLLLLILLALPVQAAPPEMVLGAGHAKAVDRVVFSADGKILASRDPSGTIIVWDAARGVELRVLHGRPGQGPIVFSPDARTLATGDSGATLWSVKTGQSRVVQGAPWSVRTLAFSPDSSLLVCGGVSARYQNVSQLSEVPSGEDDGTVPDGGSQVGFTPEGHAMVVASDNYGIYPDHLVVWDVDNGKSLLELTGAAAGFSADGSILAIARDDASIDLFNRPGRLRRTLRGPQAPHWYLVVSPNGRYLAAASRENQLHNQRPASYPVCCWDTRQGRLLFTAPGNGRPAPVLFAPDGSTVLIGNVLYRLPDGHEIARLPAQARAFCYSPDSRRLAAGVDRRLALWSTATGAPLANWGVHSQACWSVALHGDVLAAGGEDGIVLWDLSGRRTPRSIAADPLTAALAFSADGRSLTAGWNVTSARVWDVGTGQLKATVQTDPIVNTEHPDTVNAVACNADGTRLLTANWRSFHDFNLTRGREQAATPTATSWICGPAFSSDGMRLIFQDGSALKLADLRGGRERILADPITSQVACGDFSADNKMVAAGCLGGSVGVWNVSTGMTLCRISTGHDVLAVAFSPDGRMLATAQGNTVSLWDVASGHALRTLRGHDDRVQAVAFGTEGRTVISSSSDHTIRVWSCTSGAELLRLCAFDGDDWLVTSPDGFFDGSPGGWQKILWRFNQDTFDTASVEQYFNDFFEPDLLHDVVSTGLPIRELLKQRGDPRASLTLANRERRLPVLSLQVPVHTQERRVKVQVRIEQAEGGVQDVRLFNNGILLKKWPGLQHPGMLQATVTMRAGDNRLSAYAFNRDNVKSKDAVTVTVGDSRLQRAGQAWVLAVGINRYEYREGQLHLAVDDARGLSAALAQHLPETVHTTILTDERAT
ncbi:MAG: WD40 repeat domain-containing protein, partial [Candidatus Xenobia bacterium]